MVDAGVLAATIVGGVLCAIVGVIFFIFGHASVPRHRPILMSGSYAMFSLAFSIIMAIPSMTNDAARSPAYLLHAFTLLALAYGRYSALYVDSNPHDSITAAQPFIFGILSQISLSGGYRLWMNIGVSLGAMLLTLHTWNESRTPNFSLLTMCTVGELVRIVLYSLVACFGVGGNNKIPGGTEIILQTIILFGGVLASTALFFYNTNEKDKPRDRAAHDERMRAAPPKTR